MHWSVALLLCVSHETGGSRGERAQGQNGGRQGCFDGPPIDEGRAWKGNKAVGFHGGSIFGVFFWLDSSFGYFRQIFCRGGCCSTFQSGALVLFLLCTPHRLPSPVRARSPPRSHCLRAVSRMLLPLLALPLRAGDGTPHAITETTTTTTTTTVKGTELYLHLGHRTTEPYRIRSRVAYSLLRLLTGSRKAGRAWLGILLPNPALLSPCSYVRLEASYVCPLLHNNSSSSSSNLLTGPF